MHHQFPFANHNHTLHFLCFYWSLNSQFLGPSKFLPVTWEGTEIYESYLILQQMLIWWIQTVMLKAAVSSHCFLEQKSRTTTIAPKICSHMFITPERCLLRITFGKPQYDLRAPAARPEGPKSHGRLRFWWCQGATDSQGSRTQPHTQTNTPQNHHAQTQVTTTHTQAQVKLTPHTHKYTETHMTDTKTHTILTIGQHVRIYVYT